MTVKLSKPNSLTRASLTRASLAGETGCNIETIRYYEKIGLLPLPKRTENGYRIYNSDDVRRLAFIMRLRELGFTIEQTRGLLTLVDGHDYTCREVHQITLAHIDDIKAKARDLKKIQKTLVGMAEECSRGEVPDCHVIEVLYGEG
jgi:MerR family transcriptional regulator, mercuric resistance operon regulatory protein